CSPARVVGVDPDGRMQECRTTDTATPSSSRPSSPTPRPSATDWRSPSRRCARLAARPSTTTSTTPRGRRCPWSRPARARCWPPPSAGWLSSSPLSAGSRTGRSASARSAAGPSRPAARRHDRKPRGACPASAPAPAA
ncbi:MAG: hypothetical protein AVDCRST_MAG35-2998, partial [uncultured Quadrisphaera sp.]